MAKGKSPKKETKKAKKSSKGGVKTTTPVKTTKKGSK